MRSVPSPVVASRRSRRRSSPAPASCASSRPRMWRASSAWRPRSARSRSTGHGAPRRRVRSPRPTSGCTPSTSIWSRRRRTGSGSRPSARRSRSRPGPAPRRRGGPRGGAERERLLAAIADASANASADDVAEREARERLEAARERRARLDVTMTEQRLALEHLATQLAERYGLGPDALADVALTDDGLDDERAARVEALRARLARLRGGSPQAGAELAARRGRLTASCDPRSARDG